ncbi:hypothetical protein Ocin01_11067 [Orchesella cincta]|uniref:HMG box domain-containing protein n=1 Tax=Orchesella cincta TaxID=48709 RepID=A0A1D2MSB6_ORCCI|nr:hypothetical protein Ocin01_11067 [Orchesella cincta]
MISINLLDGKIVAGDSNAPIPNRTARTITESGNYGLADHAREMFRSMCVTSQEDKKREEIDQLTRCAGRGRGRGRGIRPFDPLPGPPSYASSECCPEPGAGMEARSRKATDSSIAGHEFVSVGSRRPEGEVQKYVTQCLFQDGEEVRVKGLVNANAKKGANHPNAVAKPSKPNGYVMYLQYMRKKAGVTESKTTDELIKMYDKDWKALPEDERKEWKEKAKVLRPQASCSSAALKKVKPPVVRPPPKFSGDNHAGRANAIARHLSASGLIADDEVVDDDDEW